MVLLDQVRVPEQTRHELGEEVVRQVTEIVQEAEEKPEAPREQTTSWYYGVPMPGVRYYSF